MADAVAGDGEEGGGDDGEGAHPGDFGSGRIGEHADGGTADAVGPGEVDELTDGGLTAGETTAIEVDAELLQIEGDGAHGVRVRTPEDHEKR